MLEVLLQPSTRNPFSQRSFTSWTLVAALLLPALVMASSTATSNADTRSATLLGRIEFPNSGLTEAQAAFAEGVLYLHNFEYEDAADAFRAAQEIDPDFALAYWGEAMTHNHPIWQQQNRDKANEVLARYAPTAAERLAKAPTARERAYLEALEILYGNVEATADLEKNDRDDAYLLAMQRLSEAFPDDHEARSFHALAILGSAHEGRDFATYMRAAATAMPVWERNDQHPGAAHYLIHSFDDPVHAPLGLPMAEAYAEIAPDAAHAQHMTSHIFVAMGMWPDVVRANIAARRVQNEANERRGERSVVCGHYPYWLHYGYLQRGEYAKADEVMQACQARVRNEPKGGELWHFAMMRARDVIDRNAPGRAAQWTHEFSKEDNGAREMHYVDALAALAAGDVDKAGEHLFVLPEVALSRYETKEHAQIQVLQLEGLIHLHKGDADAGLAKLKEAADMEAQLPFAFGPPEIVKPSWELYGEQLLAAGKVDEAAAAFEEQLQRTPRRALSLLGLMRAGAQSEGEILAVKAAEARKELASVWADAEDDVQGLSEVEEAAGDTPASASDAD